MTTVPTTPQDAQYWDRIAVITRWLDTHPAHWGDPLMWRVGKIVEEAGEAWTALASLAGQNPRKTAAAPGVGRVDQLACELAQVVVTASVALLTLTPRADEHLAACLDVICQRITQPQTR